MSGDIDELAVKIRDLLDAHEEDGWINTGFVLVTAAVHPDNGLDGTQGYAYSIAPNQPLHSTLGLLKMAGDYFARPSVFGDQCTCDLDDEDDE